MIPALHIHAGPLARQTIAQNGLQPSAVRTIPAAAGGPKGLILGALDLVQRIEVRHTTVHKFRHDRIRPYCSVDWIETLNSRLDVCGDDA